MAISTTSISRRNLVKGAALATGVAAFTSFVAKPALAAEDVAFDETCEVLVVGSGYAGLAAAYEAAKAGAQVRVIDKRGFMGGNSYVADGQIAVVGEPLDALQEQMDSCNACVEAGEDTEFAELSHACELVASQHRLTPRESEVLELLAQGRSRAFIQQELVLSDSTVKTHVSHIYQKLGITTKQELISLVRDSR